ncbi:MAG: phosphoribosylformylglycinamidine synthase subunit PurQ [Rhodothermales bacterium]|nr:phosphoribosylformylglycinamidine synthase subunit PurQ [Rhodothermales bacterium]
MAVNFGILVFPGSNCDHDAYHTVKHVIGANAEFIWHKEGSLGDTDVVIIPGGFSYGDYLRSGAIARFSNIMADVVRFANQGGLVLGICNGFQILCESGLLPGALAKNSSLRFVCKPVTLRIDNYRTPFTSALEEGRLLNIPVAHAEGRYVADSKTLMELEDKGRVVFRYVNAEGRATEEANPNGSANNIAGISNGAGNVVGMMPHPERHAEASLGSVDGALVFRSVINHFAEVLV